MLTELQTVILTCLVGPEDPTAFKKFCKLEAQRNRRARNPEKRREESRKTYRKRMSENPEKVRADARKVQRKYRARNIEKVRKGARESAKKSREGEKRPAHLSKRRKNHSKRYNTNPGYKLECCLRSRLLAVLRVDGASKSANTLELVGCSSEIVKSHLESKFKPGMTWENHGPVWHIDHIKPCAVFDLTNPEQQRACFHFTNLQPLFAAENISKGAKYVVR